MSVYTLNLRVFWPLFTCVLTGLVVLHHMAHRLSPEPGPEPGQEAREEDCNDQAPPVLLSLAKLILAVVACYLFIRFCSGRPGRARRGASEPADTQPKSGSSRRELLEDYYERWVRLSPHVVGHSKANVAKLVSDLVRAGRTDVAPESSLAFRGDFLQVGSSYEEHKVGSPDGFDILVPLRLPRGLRLEPREDKGRVSMKDKREKGCGKKGNSVVEEKGEERVEERGERSREEHDGSVPRYSLETPRREEWVRKNRPFADTFLRLHPRGSPPSSSAGPGGGAAGGGAYRLTPESVVRWFYPAVQRCLATVRYQYEQRCTLSLTLSEDRLQLRLTPRSDYVCCHISMAIRLLPALPLGDGLFLVPAEPPPPTTAAPLDLSPSGARGQRDLWTLYFPRQEQKLLGWLRGRVPQGSCHLRCLQLVKAIRDLGGRALDSQGGALWRSVLSSYALKTAWLRLLLATPPEAWEERHLVARVEDLLRGLRESLQERSLQHLFLGGEGSAGGLPDSVPLPRLVKEAAAMGGGLGGNLWAGVPPGALDLVAGRLAYAWSHLHRLIRLGRPPRSSLGLGRAAHAHCQHLEAD
ncbi:inositol 1,4,5-trisphosphate receptor-interacting protein-like 2 [Osmerus mordax]|uniref:inositol 1,4,5-trisphosphate receptor-interacting protein-like 2 n=1 Tax=Osmerus mordax TaxID=8014 RepID=UPI00350FBE0A